jgi:dihydropteroate synthase
MGKISEAIKKGKIEGNPNYERCGSEPIFIKTKDIIDVERWDDYLELDPNGYFLFEIEDGWIYAGLVNENNEMILILRGKRAVDVFKAIIDKKLVGSLDHAAYIGYELGKAEESLRKNKKYLQD